MSQSVTVNGETFHFNGEELEEMKLKMKILTGMDVWTNTQIAQRSLSLLKDDLANRLKKQGKWEEYCEKSDKEVKTE